MDNFINLTLIDNSVLKCKISEIIDIEGECYVVLQPISKNQIPEQALIMKRTIVDQEVYLNVIEDNEEFNDVLEYMQTHKKMVADNSLQYEINLHQLLTADRQHKEKET